jgi:hypothetical protein
MVAVAALALAASTVTAHAAPPLINGSYTDGDDANVWTIATTCAPSGCAGTVASNQGWTSPMTLTDGRWYFSVTKPDGFICSDGRYEPAVISMMVDPATLGGVVSADSNGACPGGIMSATPFQLRAV